MKPDANAAPPLLRRSVIGEHAQQNVRPAVKAVGEVGHGRLDQRDHERAELEDPAVGVQERGVREQRDRPGRFNSIEAESQHGHG